MSDPNKPGIWSEHHGKVQDGVHAAEIGHNVKIDDSEPVTDLVVKDGVVLSGSCLYCGRQWKALTPWGEVACYFLGQPVQGTTATRQGIRWPKPCGCSKPTHVIFDWGDVSKWIDGAVRIGSLPGTIYQAAGRK